MLNICFQTNLCKAFFLAPVENKENCEIQNCEIERLAVEHLDTSGSFGTRSNADRGPNQ
jgi:hypothetical protein